MTLRECGLELAEKAYEGGFWIGSNVLYLDNNLHYTDVYICPYSSMAYLRFVHFTVCKLNL